MCMKLNPHTSTYLYYKWVPWLSEVIYEFNSEGQADWGIYNINREHQHIWSKLVCASKLTSNSIKYHKRYIGYIFLIKRDGLLPYYLKSEILM
jgi:hypothetical protein